MSLSVRRGGNRKARFIGRLCDRLFERRLAVVLVAARAHLGTSTRGGIVLEGDLSSKWHCALAWTDRSSRRQRRPPPRSQSDGAVCSLLTRLDASSFRSTPVAALFPEVRVVVQVADLTAWSLSCIVGLLRDTFKCQKQFLIVQSIASGVSSVG